MTKQAQKDEERFQLDWFMGMNPGKWEFEKACSEPDPDFLVKDEKGLLGVELTEVQQDVSRPRAGSAAMRAASERDKFLRRTADHYYDNGGLPIFVQAIKLSEPGLDLRDLTRRLKQQRP